MRALDVLLADRKIINNRNNFKLPDGIHLPAESLDDLGHLEDHLDVQEDRVAFGHFLQGQAESNFRGTVRAILRKIIHKSLASQLNLKGSSNRTGFSAYKHLFHIIEGMVLSIFCTSHVIKLYIRKALVTH